MELKVLSSDFQHIYIHIHLLVKFNLGIEFKYTFNQELELPAIFST